MYRIYMANWHWFFFQIALKTIFSYRRFFRIVFDFEKKKNRKKNHNIKCFMANWLKISLQNEVWVFQYQLSYLNPTINQCYQFRAQCRYLELLSLCQAATGSSMDASLVPTVSSSCSANNSIHSGAKSKVHHFCLQQVVSPEENFVFKGWFSF